MANQWITGFIDSLPGVPWCSKYLATKLRLDKFFFGASPFGIFSYKLFIRSKSTGWACGYFDSIFCKFLSEAMSGGNMEPLPLALVLHLFCSAHLPFTGNLQLTSLRIILSNYRSSRSILWSLLFVPFKRGRRILYCAPKSPFYKKKEKILYKIFFSLFLFQKSFNICKSCT